MLKVSGKSGQKTSSAEGQASLPEPAGAKLFPVGLKWILGILQPLASLYDRPSETLEKH